MNQVKRIVCLILVVAMLLPALTGCGQYVESDEPKEMRTFTDSVGREVEIPVEVDSIAPVGPWAQLILYTLCPNKLVGYGTALTRKQKNFMDEKYWDLPVFGHYYGKNGDMNYEALIAAKPDFIIDIGDIQENIVSDMDGLQEQTGIPVIFIENTIANTPEMYTLLGEATGDEEQAATLADYAQETLDMATNNREQITDEDRVSMLYGQGEYGLQTAGAGGIHAQVLELVGVENVAVLETVSSEGRDEVSIEQVLLWNPDIVILAPDSNYSDIFKDATWADVSAVKNGKVYEIPGSPYNWIDQPPSVQSLLGIRWLGNLAYPELYDFDMVQETITFFDLFFHYDLSEDEARDLMANSTFS